MTPGTGRPPAVDGTIGGAWVHLVPVQMYTPAAMEDLRYRLGLRPEMVAPGLEGPAAYGSRFGAGAVIADAATGEMLGILGNVEIGDYPGVAGLVIYVDEARCRAGYAMIAWFRYVDRMFKLGATKVQMEVMAFNTPVHRIMRKIGARPEVVLREHFYIAGRYWDGTLYALDQAGWQAVDQRYRDVVREPAAAASSRQAQDRQTRRHDAMSMEVEYLVLADAATAADGKHYLHGAGWDVVVADRFPVLHRNLNAALKLKLPAGGPGWRLGVDVVDPSGRSVLAAPVYNDLVAQPPGPGAAAERGSLCLAFNFGDVQLTVPGIYSVVVTADGREIARTSFQVRRPAAA